MNIAIMSAISLICADAAMAARPLPAPAVAAVAASAAQDVAAPEEAASGEAPEETVEDIVVEEVAQTPDVFAPDGDEPQVPLAFADETDAEVVAKLQAYLESIDTLTGDFTQVAPSGSISSGKFYLRRPGLLRFEYEPPNPMLIVANGGMVYVRDEALETTDSYPVGKTPLKFLLRKKIGLDNDVKVVAVDRGVGNVAVTLASEDDETEGEISIIVSAPEMSLSRWIVRDLQNGITVVTLDDVVEGQRLANRLFEAPDAGGRFLKN